MDYDALRYALEGDGIFRLGECFGFIFGFFTFLLADGFVSLMVDRYERFKAKRDKKKEVTK